MFHEAYHLACPRGVSLSLKLLGATKNGASTRRFKILTESSVWSLDVSVQEFCDLQMERYRLHGAMAVIVMVLPPSAAPTAFAAAAAA
jgi:hypothetical protein